MVSAFIPPPNKMRGAGISAVRTTRLLSLIHIFDPENPEETIKLLPRVPMGQLKNVYKALYPSNRWRDFHDFNAVSVYVPEIDVYKRQMMKHKSV